MEIYNMTGPKPFKRKDWDEIFQDAFKWPEHRIFGWKDMKDEKAAVIPFKSMLRKMAQPNVTHTITLSDDLVWAVSELSRKLDPMYLYEKVMTTRMPFPVTVLQWNGEARRQAYNQMNVMQEQNAPHPETEVPAVLIIEKPNTGKYIHFLDYNYTERSLSFFPIMIETMREVPVGVLSLSNVLKNCGAEPSLMVEFLFTTSVVQKHPDLLKVMEDERLDVRCSGPVYMMGKHIRDPKKKVQFLFSAVAGQYRWLGALLALLDRPAVTRYVDTILADPAAPGTPRGVQQATNRPQTLTLLLPREKVVTKVIHLTEHERKKVGLHEVAGHWCYSHRQGKPNCHHVWPNQPTLRQVCEVCGAVRWRREAHQRGQGDTLKHKHRRATFTGVSVERLAEKLKEESQ